MKKRFIFPALLVILFVPSFGQISKDLATYPNTLQFYLFGDWGRKGSESQKSEDVKNQIALAKMMDEAGDVVKPTFIISTGDNFYPDGVNSDTDPRWKETFEDVYQGANLQCPWYVVLGNHDHHGNVNGEIDYTKKGLNQRWHMPSTYFTQVVTTPDSARVKFIFIDSTPLLDDKDPAQLTWLSRELSEGAYDWKFVVGHHPLYSGNWRVKEQAHLRDVLEQLMTSNHVDAYLCGHDHNLQYLKNGKISYFISGAGSEIYPSEPIAGMTQYLYCSKSTTCTSAFMIFSLDKSAIIVQMLDSRGQLLYMNKIAKRQNQD